MKKFDVLVELFFNYGVYITLTKLFDYFSDWKTGCPKLIEYLLKAFSDFIQESILVDVFGAKNPDDSAPLHIPSELELNEGLY